MSAKKGERILGPYEERGGYRIVEIDAAGNRTRTLFETEAKALRYIELLRASLETADHTTATALEEYKRHLADEGYKPQSVRAITWAIEMLFPEPVSLALLTPPRCESLYTSLRTEPNKHTKQPPSADTHRNALIRSKVFLQWCVSQGWLKANPLATVKGKGKRRPRGKSLGKAGNEMRVKQARLWYAKALDLAAAGDDRATSALVAMLLGMRAGEIVSRQVADLDDDEAAGDLLWIPCSKTPAGRRELEVPEVLRPLLLACAEGKTPDRFLFEASRKGDIGKPHRAQWIIRNVRRICRLAGVPEVTAHAMRGLLATITAERGMAGHLIAATLGHADAGQTAMASYAAPGSASAGARRLGLRVLNGGRSVG